jgi:hypothetical protein
VGRARLLTAIRKGHPADCRGSLLGRFMHAVDAPAQVGEITALAITLPPEHDASTVGSGVGVDHPDTSPQAPPVLEATTSKQVLVKVSRIGTWMTQWRAVILAIRDAAVSAQQQQQQQQGQQQPGAPAPGRTPDIVAAIANADTLTNKLSPIGASTWLADADGGTTAERLVGPQVETLALSLEACAGHWPHPGGPISRGSTSSRRRSSSTPRPGRSIASRAACGSRCGLRPQPYGEQRRAWA